MGGSGVQALLDAVRPGKANISAKELEDRSIIVQTDDGFLARVISIHEGNEVTIRIPGTDEQRRLPMSRIYDPMPLEELSRLLSTQGVTGFASEWAKSQGGPVPSYGKEDVANTASRPKTLGDLFKPTEGQWRCNTCMTMNKADALAKCAACESPKPGASTNASVVPAANSGFHFGFPAATTPATTETAKSDTSGAGGGTSLGDMFKPNEGQWRCDMCMVMNNAAASAKCVSCESPKPGAIATASAVPAASSGFHFGFPAATIPATKETAKPDASGAGGGISLGDMFKPNEGQWRCDMCMVMNNAAASAKCVSCESPKPGAIASTPAVQATSSGFHFVFPAPATTETAKSDTSGASKALSLGDMFKPNEGQWRCDACMVMNDSTAALKCVSCESPKPGASANAPAVPATSTKFQFGFPPATTPATTETAKTDSSGAGQGASLGDMFKPKVGQWRCRTCMTMNDSTAAAKCAACESPNPEQASTSSVSGVSNTSQGIQFGFGSSSAPSAAPAQSFTFGFSAPQNASGAPTFGISSSAPAFGSSAAPAFSNGTSAPSFGSSTGSAFSFGTSAPTFGSSTGISLSFGVPIASSSASSAPSFGTSAPAFGTPVESAFSFGTQASPRMGDGVNIPIKPIPYAFGSASSADSNNSKSESSEETSDSDA